MGATSPPLRWGEDWFAECEWKATLSKGRTPECAWHEGFGSPLPGPRCFQQRPGVRGPIDDSPDHRFGPDGPTSRSPRSRGAKEGPAGRTSLEDYSILRDALETWRATTDWVKAVVVIFIPGQIAFLIHQVLRYRVDQRAMILEEREVMTDERVRKLAEAELCRIIAEMERARLNEELLPISENRRGLHS